MYIVTGGLGFIGSNIVKELSVRGEDVIIVDHRNDADKLLNIADCASSVIDVMPPDLFLRSMRQILSDRSIKGIFHQGAIADTTVKDVDRVMRDNFDFSAALLTNSIQCCVNVVYASSAAVYGNSQGLSRDEKPLNVYGISKLLTDNFARNAVKEKIRELAYDDVMPTIVGLRYFNVYGNNEDHKGKMKSMVNRLIEQARMTGKLFLYRGRDIIRDGEHRRDFVHVDDVVKVNMHFMFGHHRTGIFDVGTGMSRSFNELAGIIMHELASSCGSMSVDYIDMPDDVKKFYQNYTQADIADLRSANYNETFTTLEDGVRKILGR